MVFPRKSLFLASVSLGAVLAGAPLPGDTADAACGRFELTPAGVSLGCTGEFQQTLTYRNGTLSLSDPDGGEPRELATFLEGNDLIALSGDDSALVDVLALGGGRLNLAEGNDRVRIAGASIDGAISGGAGNDRLEVRSTDTDNTEFTFDGDAGDDSVLMTGGSIGGVTGGTGFDRINLQGGRVRSVTGFERVDINDARDDGETIAGPVAISAADGDTTRVTVVDTYATGLDFDSLDGLEASDEINALPTLSLDLSGVSSLKAVNSAITLASVRGGVDSVELRRSLLRFSGTVDLTGSGGAGGDAAARLPSGPNGTLSAYRSVIDSANGVAGDELIVSAARIYRSTFIIDADGDAQGGVADKLVILTPDGTSARANNLVRGDNTLLVNFQDGFNGNVANIQVAQVRGADRADVLAALSRFNVIGGANTNLQRGFTLGLGGDGDLVLNSRNRENPLTTGISTSVTATTAGDAVEDITGELMDGGGDNRVQVSDTFGVFASGQFGHTWHYGLDSFDGTRSGRTADFDVDAFSAFVTGQVDLGEEIGTTEIGVTVAAFGGYVQSDVTLDRNLGNGFTSQFEGEGTNRGGMFGASVTFDRLFGEGHYAYATSTVGGFLGSTDITNADTGETGDYGTGGVIATEKFGVAFALTDRIRLDNRFGVGYTYFEGDSFRDSGGFRYGMSRTSYAMLSFDPGIVTAVPVGNYILTPQARLLLEYRPGYVNTASFEGTKYDFDEARYTIGGELGAALAVNDHLNIGAFASVKGNDDYTAVLGRIGVQYEF